jgi:hypothetical protein
MSRPDSSNYSGSHISLSRTNSRVDESMSQCKSLPRHRLQSARQSSLTSARELSEDEKVPEMIEHACWDVVASDTSRGDTASSAEFTDTLSKDSRMRKLQEGLSEPT